MTPVYCAVRHDPPTSWGDCLRACVATVLDLPSANVPHFFHDGCKGEIGTARMREWLKWRGYAAFFTGYEDKLTFAELREAVGTMNPDAVYIVYGETISGGSHVVVCQNDEVVHNPSVAVDKIIKASGDFWLVLVIAKS